MTQTLDLFAPANSSRLAAYEFAWSSWLQTHTDAGTLKLESTSEMYQHMWASFTRWAVSNQLDLAQVSVADLDAFLASRGKQDEISERYAWRFLRLVDRVFAHYAVTTDSHRNTAADDLLKARPEFRYANAGENNPLPSFLPVSEAKHLVTYLSAVRPGRSASAQPWQEVRNRAAVALMLGAGLTPSEIRTLTIDSPVVAGGRSRTVPWKLQVAGHTNTPARETPIAPWAGQLLSFWLSVRQGQSIPGNHLFPSTRKGTAWGKVSQYGATREVLEAAGMDDLDGGSYRLRHTFALRQLRRGKSAAEVAQWLGIKESAIQTRYGRVLIAPVDVV